MAIKILFKPLIVFSLIFMAFTVIGTISHELGHIVIAKYLGYKTSLHYGSMSHFGSPLDDKLNEIYEKVEDKVAFEADGDYPEKEEFKKYLHKRDYQFFLIAIGGPLQTCLTGIIGLLVLFFRKAHLKKHLSKMDWLAVFLALFWLREVFNMGHGVVAALLYGPDQLFGGDELNMALFKGWAPGAFAIPLAIIGLLVGLYVSFRVVPKSLRLTFILAGFTGSAIGFVGWFFGLGPLLLP